jgi:hypothetical protein
MDLADSFSSNGIAYNSLRIKDDEEGNYNTFDSTTITFIVDAMTDMLENERDMVALHELSHSFGLDDIYDEDYIGISLMYGVADGQEELIPELTVFDLYNLAYIYNREEGED